MEGEILGILYTGFKEKSNSSYQLLSKVSGEKIFLTNSFEGLTLFFKAVADTIEPLTDSDRINVFVVDDSLFERSSCKMIEPGSKVFDLASMRYTKGYRLMTLGWTDGNTFSNWKSEVIFINSEPANHSLILWFVGSIF